MKRHRSGKDKLRAYFRQNVGEVLDSNVLKRVAGVSEWARRVRELRDLEGWQIETNNDAADLKPGQYRLVSLKLLPVLGDSISKGLRAEILDRNGYTCQMCGAAPGEAHPFDGRQVRLHIGHIVDLSHGGTNDSSNLRALCSVCNEGAANVTPDRPTAQKLIAQLRRAPRSAQTTVLEWLEQKFRSRAGEDS
jgi:hypothetical protein